MGHNSTYTAARRNGAGALLGNGAGQFFKVSDWSNATKEVYGWKQSAAGDWESYGRLPAGLSLAPLHFVLVFGLNEPWILNLDGGTVAQCEQAIAWQVDHGRPRHEFEIVTLGDYPGEFVLERTGRAWIVFDCFPYTRLAWNAFLIRHWPNAPRQLRQYKRGRRDYGNIKEIAADPEQQAATVTESEFCEMLGVVPPVYVPGLPGFLVGEALTGDSRGTVFAHYFEESPGEFRARYHLQAAPARAALAESV